MIRTDVTFFRKDPTKGDEDDGSFESDRVGIFVGCSIALFDLDILLSQAFTSFCSAIRFFQLNLLCFTKDPDKPRGDYMELSMEGSHSVAGARAARKNSMATI